MEQEKQTKRLMLVDESAFIYTPSTSEEQVRNAGALLFINAAQHDFTVVMVTAANPDDLKARLRETDLSEALNEQYKCDQSFLLNDIRTWNDVAPCHADVLISSDENHITFIDGHDFYKHPSSLNAPDYYWYFMENYEDNLSLDFSILDSMMAQLRVEQIARQRFIATKYEHPDSLWQKASHDPAVTNLLQAFSDAIQRNWHLKHPQDEAIEKAKNYLEMSAYSYAGGKTDKLPIYRELLGFRDGFQYSLIENEMRKYDQRNPVDIKLSPEHRRMIHDALRAIHRIVRAEPRVSGPK